MALIEDIEKIVESYGAKLYDTEIVKENDENIFRVYIIKDGGVDLDLCVDISQDISPLLDIEAPISGEYRFEVSSPGIERKLTKPSHFKNSIGEKVKLKILGEGKEKGKLLSADDEGIEIETKDGVKSYKYSDLGTVKTYFDW
jgi:ribosome maturation factor RimP